MIGKTFYVKKKTRTVIYFGAVVLYVNEKGNTVSCSRDVWKRWFKRARCLEDSI